MSTTYIENTKIIWGNKMELNRIYNEDCLEGMKRIPDKSIDMILCDLPYGTTQNKWDSIIPLDKLWKQYGRVIKDNGAIVLTSNEPFTTQLNFYKKDMFRYSYIWVKHNSTGFLNANKRPLKLFETISVFYKKQPTYNPQGLIPFNKTNKRGKIGTNWMITTSNEYTQKYTNYPTDILSFSHDKQKLHPTQKPVALFEYLIRTYTNEGETVLDNCMGSGTTAIAALNTNRKYIGFENNEEYYRMALERIQEQSLLGE